MFPVPLSLSTKYKSYHKLKHNWQLISWAHQFFGNGSREIQLCHLMDGVLDRGCSIKCEGKKHFKNSYSLRTFTCSTRNCACRSSVSSVKVEQFSGGTEVCQWRGSQNKNCYIFSFIEVKRVLHSCLLSFTWHFHTKIMYMYIYGLMESVVTCIEYRPK